MSNAIAAVDTVVVFSKKMNKPIKVVVVKPNLNRKLPVIYLLHGHGGTYAAWLKDAPQLVQKAAETEAILVMPDGGYNSWYFDSPVDSTVRYESFITQELVPYIDAAYPTIANKNNRAITGLSMGGHGAFYLAIKHKDIFSAAGSICGGLDIRPFPNNWQINKVLGSINTNKENWEKYTVINVIDSLKDGELQLIFDCGVDDFFFSVNQQVHQKLLAKKIKHDYIERPGIHNGAYWRNSIDYQLLFFKKYFANNSITQ
jgi:S-formylglutathione hydrolase FrmB